jgi:hypothetical protein
VFDEMCLRWRRRDTALPAARFHSAWTPPGSPWTPLEVLTRRVAHDRGDGVRGVVGAGAGAATTTRRWCGRPMDERPCVLHGVALVHGEPQWVRCRSRRDTHGCTAEPGSPPWAAASTAPAVGWRERYRVHGGVFRATENVASPPLGDRARVPHGHGGVTAARLS